MEKKRLILTMLLSMVIIFGWNIMVYQWQKKNLPATQPTAGTTTTPSANQASTVPATTQQVAAIPTTAPSTQSAPSLGAPKLAAASSATQPAIITLGDDPAFNTRLLISTRGGALERAELHNYTDTNRKEPYIFQMPYDAQRADTAALALRSLTINGEAVELTDAIWNVLSSDNKSARLALDIQNKGEPYLRILRTYELSDKNPPAKGFEHKVTDTFENLSGQPLTIKILTNGLNQPPREIERSPDLAILVGHNDDGDATVYSHPVEGFTSSKPTIDLSAESKLPILWTGAASVYFNAILRPHPLDNTTPHAKYIGQVSASLVNLDEQDVYKHEIRTTLQTTDLVVQPNQPLTLTSSIYLGPRQRSLLQDSYYAAFPRGYDKTLVITHGPCGFCTFQPLITLLVKILGFFHFILRDWGLAIICLVLLVRAILHPITKRSQVSMMKMGKMGPEVERLKKKYGDNKDELNKAMMQVYKEQGFTPVLGCLPMFLQMPIWIALWSALQSTFELRQAPFLYGLTWIDDLAKPDQLIAFPKAIPLLFFGWQLHAINLLPLLMVVVTYMNQKFMPKPLATTPEQEQQQKMMMWMSMLFPLMFYSFPSGLNLYYVTSMGLGIIESKIVRDHIKKKEEEEKAGKVIVDAAPTRAMKRRRDDEGPSGAKLPPKKPAPTSGLGKWLADLQQKAEQIRKNPKR